MGRVTFSSCAFNYLSASYEVTIQNSKTMHYKCLGTSQLSSIVHYSRATNLSHPWRLSQTATSLRSLSEHPQQAKCLLEIEQKFQARDFDPRFGHILLFSSAMSIRKALHVSSTSSRCSVEAERSPFSLKRSALYAPTDQSLLSCFITSST